MYNDTLTAGTIERLVGFFPILVRVSNASETIGYRTLLDEAVEAKNVQRVHNTRIGRTLEWLRLFTAPRSLPDITSLVVRIDTKRPGDGYIAGFGYSGNFEIERDRCFACSNWMENDFPDFLVSLSNHTDKTRSDIGTLYSPPV